MRVGAIDIGSNSVRLLVAGLPADQPWSPDLETIARAGEACRLGRGLHETGRVDEELVERAGGIVSDFVRRARSLGARHVVAAATAALRRASNGAAAAERITELASVPVRILSEADEARLVYRSVVLGLGQAERGSQSVVFDLGGGSTEVASGVGSGSGGGPACRSGPSRSPSCWVPATHRARPNSRRRATGSAANLCRAVHHSPSVSRCWRAWGAPSRCWPRSIRA